MFKKIIDFFKRIFASIFGGSKKQNPPIPSNVNLPNEDETLAQDGSEITPDTAVVIVNEKDPVFLDDDPPIRPTDIVLDPELENDNTGDLPNDPTLPTDDPNDDPPIEDPETPKHQARFLWCLDNGHGKLTAGKRSPKLPDGARLYEYEFNRDIVKKIITELDKLGVQYYNVVPEVDIDNYLKGRVARANLKASKLPKIFLSIHSNAAPARTGSWANASISGIETWYFHNSRKGRKVASVFQAALIKATNWKNRHIKSRPTKQFYVLRHTSMTAVLTENGFYNNKEECKLLLKDEVRQKIADAHVAAILKIERQGI